MRFGPRQALASASAAIFLAAMTNVAADAATPRKHHQTAAPTPTTRDTDTSSTATIPSAKPAISVPDPTAKDDDVLPPPFRLPTASRQRMRDCGLKWQAMNTSGEVGETIWRDFAVRCLAAASGPFDKRSQNKLSRD